MRAPVKGDRMPGAAIAVPLLVVASMAWAQSDPAQGAKGEKVYLQKKCAACHMIKGKGGKAGPELSDVGAKRDAQWLKTFMKDPKAVVPKAKMMPFKGGDEELEALVAYLSSLK